MAKSNKRKRLAQDRLKELLRYNSKTGIFTWRHSMRGGAQAGEVAGSRMTNGYVQIGIDNFNYLAHQLVWLYRRGYFPEHGLDHRDRVRHHNWESNLREASAQCNLQNTGNRKNNTSGVKGVSQNRKTNKWDAYIFINYKKKNLGSWLDLDEAVAIRFAAEQCLGWESCNDASPAYNYIKENVNGQAK